MRTAVRFVSNFLIASAGVFCLAIGADAEQSFCDRKVLNRPACEVGDFGAPSSSFSDSLRPLDDFGQPYGVPIGNGFAQNGKAGGDLRDSSLYDAVPPGELGPELKLDRSFGAEPKERLQQRLKTQLDVYDAELWTKVVPWPQPGPPFNPSGPPKSSPVKPRLGEQFFMMPSKSWDTLFRSKENAYRIYSTRWPGQALRCFLLIEIPVDDGPCLELGAPKVSGEQQGGAFLDIAGNRSLVQTPGSRAAGLGDIDMHNAECLFGGSSVQERDYMTFSLDTYNGPKFKVDVIFENDQIQKYRVRSADILRPVWQLAAAKSTIPLHLVCGSGRFLYPVGVHEFPVVKASPTFPLWTPIPDNE